MSPKLTKLLIRGTLDYEAGDMRAPSFCMT